MKLVLLSSVKAAPHPPAEPVLGPRFSRTRGRVPPSPRSRGEGWGEGPVRLPMSDYGVLLQQVVNGLSLGAMYALLALGFTWVYGILELINFAHFNVFMVR